MQAPAKADRGASGLGITGNGLQGLRHGLQQQGRDDLRMLQGEGTERGGARTNDMTGGDSEGLPRPGSEPEAWALPWH